MKWVNVVVRKVIASRLNVQDSDKKILAHPRREGQSQPPQKFIIIGKSISIVMDTFLHKQTQFIWIWIKDHQWANIMSLLNRRKRLKKPTPFMSIRFDSIINRNKTIFTQNQKTRIPSCAILYI